MLELGEVAIQAEISNRQRMGKITAKQAFDLKNSLVRLSKIRPETGVPRQKDEISKKIYTLLRFYR